MAGAPFFVLPGVAMADASNGRDANGGLIGFFLRLKWQSQVAAFFAVPMTIGGGTVGVSQFWKPDPATAQIHTFVTDTNTKVTALSNSVESLNGTVARAVDLTILRLCESESDEQWLISLGDDGIRYCRAVRNKVLSDVIRDVWSSR